MPKSRGCFALQLRSTDGACRSGYVVSPLALLLQNGLFCGSCSVHLCEGVRYFFVNCAPVCGPGAGPNKVLVRGEAECGNLASKFSLASLRLAVHRAWHLVIPYSNWPLSMKLSRTRHSTAHCTGLLFGDVHQVCARRVVVVWANGSGVVDSVHACECVRVCAGCAVELSLCLGTASCFKEAVTYPCTCTPSPVYFISVCAPLCILLPVYKGPAIWFPGN